MKAESLYIQKLTYDENTGNEIIGLFPSEANPAIVSSYTYDAKRMGGAPTLTATIYSSEPLQWKKEEFVEYNGDRFFASYTPNSTKDNSSRMWKSEITFTSRRELLDNTLFFDVVVDDVDTQNKDRYRSNQTKFTFGGTINEFVARVNSSMAYCGLYRPTDKYKGYYVVVDEGYGTDEVKEVSFEDQYLTDVLQLVNTTFELDYYWDGNVCHVGKVQHDLTDTPIKYGSSDALISVSKENANYKIVDMITGYGSSDNLPYYYPNDDEFGEAVFNTENISKDKVSVELSKFLKDSRYNDTLILYKSKDGKNYNGSVDVSSKTFDRFTTPSNLTQADSQSNPTVTCIFSFDILISAIKGQTIDLTSLGFDFELNSSVSRKDYITKVGNAVKSIYLFKGKELYKTISKRMSIGSTSTYTFEEDGDFTLSIESEFSYKCKVYKNSAGINDFYGADSWNAAFSGSVEFLYESKSEYEWKNGDKYIPYSDAGINVSVISEANCIEYDYQFVKEGDRYGFNKVYTGTDDNATKVVVTDRVWIAPSSVLMPSIYRNTKGAERFYYALNNTHKLPSGSGYYEFVNLYKKGNPHQGTVTFDGIKPTIKGIVNAEGQLFGEIADVAFDKEDSDVKDSNGKYIHNYFYIKLHKFNGDFGFDLFAHALASEPAKINLIKSNGCPACSFTIDCYWNSTKNKCYNNVLTDGNGNLKSDNGKMNSKGDYILNDTYVEDNKSNQDSTKEELWIAVQKDTSTLGIVMPNASAGFKPQKGDLFVITGIKPPKVLVTAAEKRLDDALVKHMSENNTDQFNYSVKFSRIFLQENPDFASKLNENAKLSIQIQGDYDNDGNLISHKVFVSNYSVKVDNDELAEVEIELVNSLEVTKSDTKQIIDAVKGETVKSLSSIVGSSNANSFNAGIADKMYLSKLNDDTAKGTITWEKIQKLLSGFLVGNFNSENGGSWTPDTEGRSHLITDYLEVRMKAIFEELVIKKTSTIGGKEILSPAGGVVAHKVEEVTVTYNNVSQKAYRCYFLAEQEGDSVDNDFAIGDQVRSESFNVRKGTYHKVGNHFYWRLIIGRDEEPVELEGKKYHYIDISDTDCATASDIPANGDVLNQCGNRTDVDRQNCLIFSAVDTYSPSVSLYHGINSYSFANKEYVEYGVNKKTNKAFFNVYGDMYVGDRPTKENGYEGSSYIKYDSAAKQVSVKGKISAKSTVDGKELSQYIKENSAKGLTEEQVNNLIKNSQVIADLQNQVDGAIETWFYEGVPTLKNAPASSWTTDKEKDTHLGDLYYDNKTGKAYRFAKDGSTYKWTVITDTDIAKALSDAAKAQETADGKMKVFSTQPIPPYQLGDIWVNATYPTDGSIYKNEILRCQTAKAKGSSFAIADWTKASKYTDDSALNTFKEEYKNDMASYKEQLDEKVETWFYNYAPTTQNKPASDWTTDTLKSQHAGDLFYNTSKGYTYRWTGTAWARIKDNDINTAMTAASKAQDTADGKRTVFTSQPTVPYDEGDLWASGGDDGKTLMVCIKGRTTGSFTSSEWVKANDSDLNAFAKTIEESLNGIRDQLDKKAETWYQPSDPSASWTTDDAKKEHKGDLWYNTSNNQTFFWNGTKWDKQDVPTEVFDKIDGKSSIYVSKPASYAERDLWILEAAYTLSGVAYSKGELVVATKSNASFSAADWTKKVKYTDDTVANAAKKAAEKAQKAAEKAQGDITKLGTTVTDNKKAFDNYVTDGYLEPSEIAAMAQDSKRLEDAFAAAEKSYTEVKGAEVLANTKELTDLKTAFATLTTAKTELVTYLSDISARYNAANTEDKATIVSAVGTKFTNFQSAYSAFYDKLGLANAYITSKIYGDLKQNITDLAGYKYIKDALGQTTDIDGGLVMTTLLALRDADGNVQSGINGAIDPNRGKKSIATWWGGQMVDKDYNSGSLTPATSLVRFDGSGYLANGAIWWDVDGKVHADPTSFIISEKNLGAYLTFFEPTWKSGSAGTSVADLVSLKPNAPFSKLGVSGDATFEGAITFHGISITYDATNKAIKVDGNLYATGGITAYGAGTSTSTGGGLNGSVKSYADALKLTSESLSEVASAYSIKALSRRIDNIATELGGLSLSWDNITGKPSTFAPSAHTHKWAEITDRITKVSQLTNDSGYTKNTGTVTSVSLTLPAGLTCATKTITTSGTFAISLASGYSIPTTAKQTAWDGAVSAKHTHSNKSVLDGISSTKVSHWNSAYDWYALMTTDEETADGIINKWNEVVSFLANIAQTDTLSGIVDGINKSISDEVARAKKAEGVNASGISANKTSITTLQGYFTNGSAKKALQLTNARKLWGNSFNGTADINGSIIVPSGKYISIGNIKMEYDAANKALKITNTTTEEVANLYTSGGVSAYGVGASSSSGGGLNGSVKAYADAIRLTTENLSEIASAYSVAKLYSEIQNVASAVPSISVSVPTGGNALTGATYDASTGTITFTKGTFLTAHQSLDSYVNEIAVSGTGNAITAVSKSGKKVTFTKGATYLTTHQSLAAYATQNWVKNEATAHNADMVDNYHASGLFTGFSISDVANKVTISIGGTSKALNLVRAFPSGVGNNFNDIATHGNSMGMSNIAAPYASSTANYQTLNGYVNPNGQTGWHHYINLSYTDSNNTATSPNMWQTQFAIKAGTTEVYVRSRAGGKISNDAAWAAPWVRLARVTDNVASASKVANALSWSGYSSGSYNGSAVKSISIPNNTNQLTNGAGFITSSASITGNAGSATKLQNARTINGTSFNGTANIVTSYWGTTRKLWGNSVNGNADVNGSITIANTDGVYVQIGDVRLVYDKANTAIKVVKSDGTTAANFYATGGITAYGEGSGSSGGGGLNGSVKSYADALKLTSESLSEIASAYSIKALDSRISSLEGGSATSIETTGSGNAVTSVSKSGTKITFTKGSTFSLNGHTHDFITVGANQTITATQYTNSRLSVRPYYNSGGPTTYGNILEVVSRTHGGGQLGMAWSGSQTKTDGTDTNVGKLYYRSKRDNIAGWTVWKRLAFAEELAWGNISGKPTSLSGYGITDGVNAVSVTGSGNAVTAASVSGHTLTLAKGSTFSLSNHTHYVGTTRVQGSSAEQALTGITKIDNILKLSKATVTVNTSYKAEQNRLVIYGYTYGNDANYIKSAGKLSYGDGGPQLVFSTSENPDASGVQSAALVYTDHDTIGVGASLSFVTNQGDAYFIAPHIKALTAFQGNLAWSYITNKPTTLSGFGITDGLRSVTQPSGSNVFVTGISTSGTAITYTKSYTKKSLSVVGTSGWTNASIDGNIIPDMSFIAHWNGAYSGTSSNLAYCNKGAFGSFAIKNSLAFSELTSKPTTISGYGITDAYTKSQVDAIAAKYLPLTGGTLTGQLRIAASALNGAYNGLLIGDDCYIGDCNSGNTIGLMGVGNNNAGMVKFGKGGMLFGYNGSNHIASNTAQWTNLNADLLDGWHKGNIVWSGAVNSNTASLSHYWAKLFDITVTGNQYDDRSFTFLFSNGYNDTYSIVVLKIRQNGAKDSGAYRFSISLRELVGNMSSRLRVYYNNATGNVQLWGNCQGQYGCLSYTIIKKTGRTSADFASQGTLVTNTSFSAAQSLPATTGNSPYTLLDGATRIGIVKQADQLVTARSLWGQSFNGTANVSGSITGVDNITMSNNSYLYGKNTGGTAIQLIAMASWNSVDIGRGALVYGYTTQVMGKTVALTASDDSGKNTKSVELSTAKFYSNVNIETEGGLLAHGGVTAYSSSDIRLKQDLRKLDYFGIIKAMGGTFGFAWKKDNTRSIGWIAQHVLCNPHLKDIVETDEKGYYKINYWSPKLIATAFGAIEQVGDEVSSLKARVVFLESEVQRLSGKQGSSNKKRLDNKNINLLN
jgi:hypothetical protein